MLDIPGALLQHFPLKGHLRSHYDVIFISFSFFSFIHSITNREHPTYRRRRINRKVRWSHYDVIGSPYVFLPITFHRNELETCGWCHSVRLVKAHRLICNMTYLGHTVTLTWRDLRSKFKMDLPRIKSIWIDPA